MKAKFFFLLGFLWLSSCSISYKFNGASIDYTKTKTISIANFPIRAALVYTPLENVFTEELRDIFTKQTKLRFVEQDGDMQLEGEITGYGVSPQAIKSDGYASLTRLTITVHVKYSNKVNEEKDFDKSYSAYSEFDASRLLDDVQDGLIVQISKELVDRIFNDTAADW
ncbi:MAG TPA: hypothetical protein DDY68_03745 [Porphyromonadaceae bacterium]|nr:hypothetical protein [Porphyromonadaceae bacterium]